MKTANKKSQVKHTSIWCTVSIWNIWYLAGKSTTSYNIHSATVSSIHWL